MILEKYSIGIGDRFGHQGKAQLEAITKAKKIGVNITPVWNKSHREHNIIGTTPPDVRLEAEKAVKACKWTDSYYVDADHINLDNVDNFIESSDFFTIDVADFISKKPDENDLKVFVDENKRHIGVLEIPDIEEKFEISEQDIYQIAEKFLSAIKEAVKIYNHIENKKGIDNFITELSVDESDNPQTPVELFFILSAVAQKGIPIQTIAPKFTGRFNKGVDYVGDIAKFEKEFNQDIAVIKLAVKLFNLPTNLKLSVHSGSDKFSIYPFMNKALKKFNAGLHLKTAGTTWLEELIGLSTAEGQGLQIAKEIYYKALDNFEKLCTPYANVIDINKNILPSSEEVEKWDSYTFASVLRHDQSCSNYNPDFRQLLHVGYKIAADMGQCYLDALEKYEDKISENVITNIYERHIKPVFID